MPDLLKTHRLFVRGVANDPERIGAIALASTLNIVAIAGGIASDNDEKYFKWEGSELGQGNALAPARAPADVADFLRNGVHTPH